MALIKCPECGKEISNKAKFCPQCGYANAPIEIAQRRSVSIPSFILVMFILTIAICTYIIVTCEAEVRDKMEQLNTVQSLVNLTENDDVKHYKYSLEATKLESEINTTTSVEVVFGIIGGLSIYGSIICIMVIAGNKKTNKRLGGV